MSFDDSEVKISHLWSFKQEKKVEIDCDEIVAIASSQKQETLYLSIIQDDEYKVYELKSLEDLEKLDEDKIIYQTKETVRRLVASKKFLLVVKES